MIIGTRAGEATLTLTLHGRLDAEGATALRPAMEQLAAEAPPRIVLDMHGVGYMDGAGLGALAFLAKRLDGRTGGSRLRLEGVAGQPLALLRHLGLDTVFGLPAAPRGAAAARGGRLAARFAWGARAA